VVAWAVLFVAISSAEATEKFFSKGNFSYSQKGYFMMDYKVGQNLSRFENDGTRGDFSKKESTDLGTQRFRVWNYWKLGEFANAEWMWEIDSVLGNIGPGAGRSAQTNPLTGDVVKIETGIARLDVTIPTTDWHIRMGQQSFFTVLPMFQERVPGIKIYKAGGWIKPTIFFIPEEKTLSGVITTSQENDDQIVGAWLDIAPMKGLKFQPYFLWNNRSNENPTTITVTDVPIVPGVGIIDTLASTITTDASGKNDFQRADFGFTSEYKTKDWYVNYLVVGQVGKVKFDSDSGNDRDIGAWATEMGAGYNWGVNTFSIMHLYRSGTGPRNGGGKISGWTPIVTFFANKNRQSQMITTVEQHPTHDIEIAAGATGPNNDSDAGWQIFGVWWKRPVNKQLSFELGFNHIQTAKKIDTDGDFSGDSRVMGEAFDLILRYKVTKGLTFYGGNTVIIPGKGMDQPNGSGGSDDAPCCPWQLFASAILRF
jgi:hypothetical protein